MAASYWIAASDVAPTSAPVNVVGQRRSTPPATVTIGGQRWRSTMPATVNGGRSRCTMMMCHLSIRPAATCTVPRTQLLAASRRHVAASYWTAASDMAPTSAQSSPSVNDGQRRRSTTVNAAGHQSTAVDHGGDRWSTMAVNDGRRWRTTVDCR
nr:hypothetical protein [Tanacetum cinerariifolium]